MSAMAAPEEAVMEAIRGAALCTLCIARKVGAAPLHVISVLAGIGQRLKLIETVARCDDCGQVKDTSRV